MQFRLTLPAPSDSTDLVHFNSNFNPYTSAAILKMSFLTMTLRHHHVHVVSEIHNIYSLDFHLASGIWHVLKDLSRTIHKAANPTIDPFESLPHYVNPNCLSKIGMTATQILLIEKHSQNMLLNTTSIDQVFSLFRFAQTVALDAVCK